MKKTILLLFIMIFLTGCTAEVNVNISHDTISEEINITSMVNEYQTKEQIYNSVRKYVPIYNSVNLSDTEPDVKKEEIAYYKLDVTDLPNGYVFKYSNEFDFFKYKEARTIDGGFVSPIIQKDFIEKEILITTDNGGIEYFNYYPDLEKVRVNITSPCPVKETNADSNVEGVYTWEFNKNTRKGIYVVLDITECDPNLVDIDTLNDKKDENEVSKYVNKHPVLVGIFAFLSFIVVVLILSKIGKTTNK